MDAVKLEGFIRQVRRLPPTERLQVAANLDIIARRLRASTETALTQAEKRYCKLEGIKPADFLARKKQQQR